MGEQFNKLVAPDKATANSDPTAAVIQRSQSLFGITVLKAFVGNLLRRVVNARCQPERVT